MLTSVRDAEIICAAIQDVQLQRRFQAVLLASHLVNVADEHTRRAFLRTCRIHLAPDGEVLIQRLPLDCTRG